MAPYESIDHTAAVIRLLPLLQSLLQLAQQQQWDAFIEKSGELAMLDYRILSVDELPLGVADSLRQDILQAQALLQAVTQLAQQEQKQISNHLILLNNQVKLGAVYGQ